MIYKLDNGGIMKLQNNGKIPRKQQKMFDRVTQSILNDTRDKNINTTGGFAHRTEEPLKVEHPGAALLLRKIPIGRVLTVLGNPASASTTAGAMAATAVDAAGVVASAQGLSNSANKIKSGDYTWRDVPETVLSAMGALPGASVMTRPGSWVTAANNAKRYGEMSKTMFTHAPQKSISTVQFDPRVKPISRPISEAERLGIPKSMRSNPKALEDPYYWGYQQWNQRYNAAVESGNMEEVQRLRDLHFKLFTPENKIVNINGDAHKVYHGSPANWYIFDDYKRGVDDAIYFSSDKNYADQFTIPRVEWKEGMIPTKESRAFYLYGKEPIDIGDDMYYGSVQDALIHNWANNGKADSVYGLDAITPPLKKSNGIEFGIVRKNQAKLADPITYDNFKRIISIVKRDNFHNPDIRYKSGGILKGQHGILTPWYKAYNSKFGKGVRDLMFGKDYNLSDEEYVQKHGYAKPITGTGMLPGKTSMNAFEGVENLVKGSFGTGAKYNAGQQIMKTNAISKTVQPKTASNWDKFLKKSLDEQNKIVKYWDERYSTMRQLQANQKQFRRFVNWINKQ